MKILHKVALVAIDTNGLPVRSDNCDDAVMFVSRSPDKLINVIAFWVNQKKCYRMVTNKGEFLLDEHSTNNYWFATCSGIKVQVSLKKMIGELRYWS